MEAAHCENFDEIATLTATIARNQAVDQAFILDRKANTIETAKMCAAIATSNAELERLTRKCDEQRTTIDKIKTESAELTVSQENIRQSGIRINASIQELTQLNEQERTTQERMQAEHRRLQTEHGRLQTEQGRMEADQRMLTTENARLTDKRVLNAGENGSVIKRQEEENMRLKRELETLATRRAELNEALDVDLVNFDLQTKRLGQEILEKTQGKITINGQIEEMRLRKINGEERVATLTRQRDDLANEILDLQTRLGHMTRFSGKIAIEEARVGGEVLTLQNSRLRTNETIRSRQLDIVNGQAGIMR